MASDNDVTLLRRDHMTSTNNTVGVLLVGFKFFVRPVCIIALILLAFNAQSLGIATTLTLLACLVLVIVVYGAIVYFLSYVFWAAYYSIAYRAFSLWWLPEVLLPKPKQKIQKRGRGDRSIEVPISVLTREFVIAGVCSLSCIGALAAIREYFVTLPVTTAAVTCIFVAAFYLALPLLIIQRFTSLGVSASDGEKSLYDLLFDLANWIVFIAAVFVLLCVIGVLLSLSQGTLEFTRETLARLMIAALLNWLAVQIAFRVLRRKVLVRINGPGD